MYYNGKIASGYSVLQPPHALAVAIDDARAEVPYATASGDLSK